MHLSNLFHLSLHIPRCLSLGQASTGLSRGLRLSCLLFVALLINACSDSDDDIGFHKPDPTEATVEFPVSLTGMSEVPSVDTDATGMGLLTLTVDDSVLEGSITVMDMDATEAHIHSAFAGANGDVIIPLEEVSGSPGVWQVPSDTMLNAAETETLLSGGMYVNVHSEAFPSGEIRGQLLPEDVGVLWLNLSGEEEVPAVETEAGGRAAVTVDTTDKSVVVNVRTTGLDNASAAHIHQGFAGVSGDIVVGLTQSIDNVAHWMLEETELTDAQFAALLEGQMYINVHSPENPAGEVRGQILPSDISVHWVALSGENEVPAVSTDAAGRAAVTVDSTDKSVVVHGMTMGLADATAAHIHQAFAGMNGDVVIPLMQSVDNADHWMLEETELTGEQYEALLMGQMYINVHTSANPGGELRGQILPNNLSVHWASLSGENEVPPVTTDASGRAAVTLDTAAIGIVLRATTTGVDDATAAHIHKGAAGVNGPVVFPLSQSDVDPGVWMLAPTELTQELYDALLAGELYVNVHTPAYPGGEIRGQIMP